jgi:hypothetical protein
MIIRLLTWLVSLGVHAAFAVSMLMPTGGTALEQGAGEDIMVVEQGLMLEGFAKLGEELVTIEEVQAPPIQMAMAQPLPEEKQPVEIEDPPVEEPEKVEPVEERQVIASEAGPDQVDVKPAEANSRYRRRSRPCSRKASRRSAKAPAQRNRGATPPPTPPISARSAPTSRNTRSIHGLALPAWP